MTDTVESTRELLRQLEALARDTLFLCGLVRCSRCKADPGTPCRRRDGSLLPHTPRALPSHAARIDAGLRVQRRCPLHLTHELALHVQGDRDPGCTPAAISKRLRASKLYKLAVEHGAIHP